MKKKMLVIGLVGLFLLALLSSFALSKVNVGPVIDGGGGGEDTAADTDGDGLYSEEEVETYLEELEDLLPSELPDEVEPLSFPIELEPFYHYPLVYPLPFASLGQQLPPPPEDSYNTNIPEIDVLNRCKAASVPARERKGRYH